MSNNSGWIKLYRQLIDSEIFASQIGLKIWIWCLIKAFHKRAFIPIKIGKGESIITVERGSFIFGRYTAEKELNINGSTVYKWIQKLQEMEMIEIESNSHYSIITICNYDDYQRNDEQEVTAIEQPLNNHSTAIEQPLNNHSTAIEQPLDSQVTTIKQPRNTYNNIKNDNNVENVNNDNNKIKEESKKNISSSDKIKDYLNMVPGKWRQSVEMWLNYKRDRKELYKNERSFKSFFKTIEKESQGNSFTFQTAVEQSIKNNWAGVFPKPSEESDKRSGNKNISDESKANILSRLYGNHPAVDHTTGKDYGNEAF